MKDSIKTYKASSQQEELFYLIQMLPFDYYKFIDFRIYKGQINMQAIEHSIYNILLRHDSFRTNFKLGQDQLFQYIKNEPELSDFFEVIEYNDIEYSDKDRIEEILNKYNLFKFDLENEPLIKFKLILLKESFIIIIMAHHIITDYMSQQIIWDEFVSYYNAKVNGTVIALPASKSYVEYSNWQNEYKHTEKYEAHKKFWSNYLSDEANFVTFPFVNKNNSKLYKTRCLIKGDKYVEIKSFCLKNRVLFSSFYLLALDILVNKYCNQNHFLVECIVSGRANIKGFGKACGLFARKQYLAQRLSESSSLLDLLKDVSNNLLSGIKNDNICIEKVIRENKINSHEIIKNINVVFDCIITPNSSNDFVGLERLENDIDIETNAIQSDLSFYLFDKMNEVEIILVTKADKIFEEQVNLISFHLNSIIDQILLYPNKKLDEIDILTNQEKNQILYKFNETKVDYPYNTTIIELFERQVKMEPLKTAIIYDNKEINYEKLNIKVNKLASHLKNKGLISNNYVAVLLERSIDYIISILAILKNGAIYIPIDTNLPDDRINFIIKDSETKYTLTGKKIIKGREIALPDNQIFLDKNLPEIDKCPGNNPNVINSSGNSNIYIIYTSGSTGKPKGVKGVQRGLINRLNWGWEKYPYGEDEVSCQKTNLSFVDHVVEIFSPLVKGIPLVILKDREVKDVEEMMRVLNEKKISRITLVPSLLKTIIQIKKDKKIEFDYLKYVFCSGEILSFQLAERFYKEFSNTRLVNIYGSTEVSADASYYNVLKDQINKTKNQEKSDNNKIPIGKPINNALIYILDKYEKNQPIGVTGEICISGDVLSSGYLRRPELTEKSFVPNPYIEGRLIYKTGDLGRWLPDGNIEFIGRIGNQVKIRGFRIELGEIESILNENKEVKESVVVTHEIDEEDKIIIAYVVLSDQSKDTMEIKAYLKGKLPDYMVPSIIVSIEKMPLTASGKIDKKQLPNPIISDENNYIPPSNDIEKQLTEVWSEVLKIDAGLISIDANFFNLGGHSLNAIRLISKVFEQFDIFISLTDIFNYPTIKGLAGKLCTNDKTSLPKMEKAPEWEYYPLTSAQKRIYILQQYDLNGIFYNIALLYQIEGQLDIVKLEWAFRQLIVRHESLRTSFQMVNGELRQIIHPQVDFNLELLENKDNNAAISNFAQPFDLHKAPLMRVIVNKQNNNTYVLGLDIHHIIGDGTSMSILFDDLHKLYDNQVLNAPQFQYKDYAVWQQKYLSKEVVKKHQKLWLELFSGEIPVLDLPYDFPRPLKQEFEGVSYTFVIGKDTTEKIRQYCQQNETTLFNYLLAVYKILLSKLSGQEDIIVGTINSGRDRAELKDIVGMFINTMPIRSNPAGNKTFEEYLNALKTLLIQCYENINYPYEELVEAIDVKRDLSRNPLFDTLFVVQNFEDKEFLLSGLKTQWYRGQEANVSKFDISLIVWEYTEKMDIQIEYSTRLFKEETIKRIGTYFENLINDILLRPNGNISTFEILTREKKEQLIYGFNNTKTDYPKEKTIIQLFEEQVLKSPNAIALESGGQRLTYHELNEKSNQLGRYLRNIYLIKPDDRIGIMLDRGEWMIIGILGILKSGASYVPVDISHPHERKKFMIENSEIKVLLTEDKFFDEISDIKKEDIRNTIIYQQYEKSNLEIINQPENIIYTIYTSGSTGVPKGVLTKNRCLVNFIFSIYNTYDKKFTEHDVCLNITNYSFDVSVCEIFVPLMFGGKIIVPVGKDYFLPNILADLIVDNKVTFTYIPPALLSDVCKYLLEKKKEHKIKLNKLLVGVEPINKEILDKFYQVNENIHIINGYGPTETTICSTMYDYSREITTSDIVPIGKPIANTRIYLLDNYLNLVIEGATGEICIAGDGMALGYLGDESLTKNKFVNSHFLPNEKIYRTGDIARRLKDGNLLYVGRKDQQVKIRGYRIELGEIESKIRNIEFINDVVVIVREDDNKAKYLCAYYVSETELESDNLRAILSKSLPDYMIPSFYTPIEKIPLTPNGKVDKKALPDTIFTDTSNYVAPTNDTETKLTEIWSGLLGIDSRSISTNANFFNLGGHSLNAIRLISRVFEEFDIAISLPNIFNYPTIKGLAEQLSANNKIGLPKMEKAPEQGNYPLTSAQKRIYILQQYDLNGTFYNISLVFQMEGQLDIVKLEWAFRQLIARHESLRTSFQMVDGELRQIIHPEVRFDLELLENKDIKAAISSFVQPFDLQKAPLMRVMVNKQGNNTYILGIDIHHIVSDGTSEGILFGDLQKLYDNQVLNAPQFQYKDYAVWQQKYLCKEVIKKQQEFWLELFSGEIPVLDLPCDFPRPLKQEFEGNSYIFELDKATTQKIQQYCQQNETTLFNYLLAIYKILLSKLSGQEDIIVGAINSGRDRAEVKDIVGMFINTIPIRIAPAGNKTFDEYLKALKTIVIQCFENVNYPYEELVEAINVKRDLSRNPLFDTLFTVQNFESKEFQLSGLKAQWYEQESNISKFDMSLYAWKNNEKIDIQIEYSTRLFKEETIKRFGTYFKNLVNEVLLKPDSNISALEILTTEEKEQILYKFNDTKVEYPQSTIIDLFERQVKNTPLKTCIIYDNKEIQYEELNIKANKLATYLKNRGLISNEYVAVLVERSLEYIISILAILKNGSTYIPIDTNLPDERINFIIKDSETKYIITEERIIKGRELILPDNQILIDRNQAEVENWLGSNIVINSPGNSNIYVIYTSGSTGKPKGVKGTQRGLINRLFWGWEKYPYVKNEICFQKTSLSFVDHVVEIFSPLLKGIPLVILKDNEIKDVEEMTKLLIEKKISRITLVPSLLQSIIQIKRDKKLKFDTLKYVFCSGEILSFQLAEKFYKEFSNTRLVNIYGSTEVSADATYYNVDRFNVEEVLKYFKNVSNNNGNISENSSYDVNLGVDSTNGFTLPNVKIEKIAENFLDSNITNYPVSLDEYYSKLYKDVIPYTINTASPTFIGHMTSILPDYVHEFSKLISQLNQNLVKIETSKSVTFLEREAIAILHRLFYSFSGTFYEEYIQKLNSNLGVITSGGTTANITALLTARNKKLLESTKNKDLIHEESIYSILQKNGYKDMVLIGTELMHYSFKKSMSIMGLGTKNIVHVKNDENGIMSTHDLELKIEYCRKEKFLIIAIVGIAGSTERGSIDPLSKLSEIAKQNDIHFHVDAAWGGALIFSDEHKHLIKGIENADSITFCGHKQLFLPQGISVCLFKDPSQLNYSSTVANYQAQPNSFDTGRYTIEGSRSASSMCLHASLRVIGKKGYELLINSSIDKAKSFAKMIQEIECFELISRQINIINYRYIPLKYRERFKNKQLSDNDILEINKINNEIQENQFYQGKTFVSKTTIKDVDLRSIVVFRVVISNPLTTQDHLINVLKDQISIIEKLYNEHNDIHNRGVSITAKDKTANKNKKQEKHDYKKIPIGKPINNANIYILDKNCKIQPIGVTGEICISGDVLSNGYTKNLELTEISFVPNPYIENGLMYKTGDLGRWLPDGNIEFLGRIGNQVKIRGFRIELGEIESILNENKDVKESVVVVHEIDEEDKIIIAYVVLSDTAMDTLIIKDFLKGKLPDYMVPSIIVSISKMPLTASGKIDKKQLPNPIINDEDNYIAPCNEIETKLTELWSEVLKIDAGLISTDANYFDLGGHSLNAITFIFKLQSLFGVEIKLNEFYLEPTIKGLAKIIQVKGKLSISNNVSKEILYFGDKHELFGIIQKPETKNEKNIAIIICSPIGLEQIVSIHSCVYLAKQFATNGYPTLRFDYFGSGDSYGDDNDLLLERTIKDTLCAIDMMKNKNDNCKIYLLGIRYGGLVASLIADKSDIDGLILMNPVLNGTQYINELNGRHNDWLKSSFFSGDLVKEGIEYLGYLYNNKLVKELKNVKLSINDIINNKKFKILIINDEKVIINNENNDITCLLNKSHKFWLKGESEEEKALIPYDDIEEITKWLKAI